MAKGTLCRDFKHRGLSLKNMTVEAKKYTYRSVAIPPGDTLLEVLEFLNMSQKELAERMGRPLKLVNEIVKGKASITSETAIQLERVLGKEAAFWSNLEAGFQEALARQEADKRLVDEIEKVPLYPYAEMVKNGWVSAANSAVTKARNLLEFFAVNSLDNVVENRLLQPVFYKISSKKKVDSFAVSAWLRKGAVDAQEINTKPFNEEILKEKLTQIRELTSEKPQEFLEKITSCLAEAGIAFVVTRNLKNVPVNGASRWLGSDKALIQLSIYGRFADKFWFSLFHEIGHIILHGKRDFNIDISNGPNIDLKEAQANEYAKDLLIPSDKYLDFISKGEFNAQAINQFAQKVKIHPGIVVGRLQFEELVGFNQLNHLRGRYTWGE